MTDNRKSGIALIIGSLGGILTMAIHPTAAHSLSPEQVGHLAIVSGVAHTIAMVSVVMLFLGACGLALGIASSDRLSFAGLVVFGFACTAIFIAATVSGFIIPATMKRMVRDVSVNANSWEIVIAGIFQFNQAFARIYSVAASLAIMLWSGSALRNGGFSRGVAIYGCIISVLIIVAVSAGHIRLDVHGMTVVWLAQTIWFVLVGSELVRVEISN